MTASQFNKIFIPLVTHFLGKSLIKGTTSIARNQFFFNCQNYLALVCSLDEMLAKTFSQYLWMLQAYHFIVLLLICFVIKSEIPHRSFKWFSGTVAEKIGLWQCADHSLLNSSICDLHIPATNNDPMKVFSSVMVTGTCCFILPGCAIFQSSYTYWAVLFVSFIMVLTISAVKKSSPQSSL